MRRLALVLAFSCAAPSLPEVGQVVIYVDTDAWVPELGRVTYGPVFDTLRVDVLAPDGSSTTRTFALGAQQFRDHEVSFGLRPPPGASGRLVRLRMYPSFASKQGEVPFSTAVIDTTVELPVVGTTGVIERHVSLFVADVGLPRGTDRPVALEPGPPGPSLVDTWAGATIVKCTGTARPGEVCVPGGAFWMGNRLLPQAGLGDGADHLRLVVLSPFFIDATEVTVAPFRDAKFIAGPWSGGTTGDAGADFCTLATDSSHDNLPINCVTVTTATHYCERQGASLPSEAQFEYVAGGLRGHLYVWGQDNPTCSQAVLGRGGWGVYVTQPNDCKTADPPGGALPVKSGSLDVLHLEGGDIFDVAGNVAEWTRDLWQRQDEPCWSSGGVYVDPVCTNPSTIDVRASSMRGGSFIDSPLAAAAASRNFYTGFVPFIGFRCARPDK